MNHKSNTKGIHRFTFQDRRSKQAQLTQVFGGLNNA
jgi:hypothetical protein